MTPSPAHGFPAFAPRPGRRGRFAPTWWGTAWVTALEGSALDQGPLRAGRAVARSGAVGPITVGPGLITARVEDQDDSFHTTIHLATFDDDAWDRFDTEIARRGGLIAALADGEMPRSLIDAAIDAEVPFLPTLAEIEPDCECPEWDFPCRHAAALAYQTAWLLDGDPLLLFLLRGREERAVLGDLVRRHAAKASGIGQAGVGQAGVGQADAGHSGTDAVTDAVFEYGEELAEIARYGRERARSLTLGSSDPEAGPCRSSHHDATP